MIACPVLRWSVIPIMERPEGRQKGAEVNEVKESGARLLGASKSQLYCAYFQCHYVINKGYCHLSEELTTYW